MSKRRLSTMEEETRWWRRVAIIMWIVFFSIWAFFILLAVLSRGEAVELRALAAAPQPLSTGEVNGG